MDFTSFFFLFSASVLFISLLHFLNFFSSNGRKLPLPPSSMSWPYIGDTFQLCSQNPNVFFASKQKSYGAIFKSHVMGFPCVMISSPEAAKFVLVTRAHLFKPMFPASEERMLGKLRKLLRRAFMPEAIKHIVSDIESIAKDRLQSLEGRLINTFQEMKTVNSLRMKFHFRQVFFAFLVLTQFQLVVGMSAPTISCDIPSPSVANANPSPTRPLDMNPLTEGESPPVANANPSPTLPLDMNPLTEAESPSSSLPAKAKKIIIGCVIFVATGILTCLLKRCNDCITPQPSESSDSPTESPSTASRQRPVTSVMIPSSPHRVDVNMLMQLEFSVTCYQSSTSGGREHTGV